MLIAWSGWSAQALMLSYMEGQPIYNACNFMLDPFSAISVSAHQRHGHLHQDRRLPLSLRRKRGHGGRQRQRAVGNQVDTTLINNYYASVGTTNYVDNVIGNFATVPYPAPDPRTTDKPGEHGGLLVFGLLWHPVDHRRHVEHRGL